MAPLRDWNGSQLLLRRPIEELVAPKSHRGRSSDVDEPVRGLKIPGAIGYRGEAPTLCPLVGPVRQRHGGSHSRCNGHYSKMQGEIARPVLQGRTEARIKADHRTNLRVDAESPVGPTPTMAAAPRPSLRRFSSIAILKQSEAG